MNRIALGTAQFGFDYGINNKRGKIPATEVSDILSTAGKHSIDTLDTAYGYGESEEVIGKFINSSHSHWKIISKLPICDDGEVAGKLFHSLNRLNASLLYGYLIHSFESYRNNKKIWLALEKQKIEGRVEKIGFSLYHPLELESLLEDDLKIDIIQIPFSVFDQRFASYLPELKKRGIEIYARSIFLQGLVFKKPDELSGAFKGIKSKIEQLNILSAKCNVSIASLCISFALNNEFIGKAIVGIDNIKHLNETIEASESSLSLRNITVQLTQLKVDDEKIILPFNWGSQRVAAL